MRASVFDRCRERIDEIKLERESLRQQIHSLENERWDLREKMLDLEYSPDGPSDTTELRCQIQALKEETQSLRDKEEALFDEWMEHISTPPFDLFERPRFGFAGLLSKPLGLLPICAKCVDPTEERLGSVGSYRLAGFALFICAAICLISLALTVPWLGISPGLVILAYCKSVMPWWLALPCTAVTIIWIARKLSHGMVMPDYTGKPLDRAAMYEEQWFRMGAESWSGWQRLYSCMSFGAVHLVNVIYPAASLMVVGMVGGVFMWVYLREYKRSGDRERAVLASTKLHAAYNRFAFLYLLVAMCVMTGLAVSEWVI